MGPKKTRTLSKWLTGHRGKSFYCRPIVVKVREFFFQIKLENPTRAAVENCHRWKKYEKCFLVFLLQICGRNFCVGNWRFTFSLVLMLPSVSVSLLFVTRVFAHFTDVLPLRHMLMSFVPIDGFWRALCVFLAILQTNALLNGICSKR